tara:strand:- start:305 stop:496 length:192 start_codon:yes stop_codon:yes gene_type:complete
MNDVCKNLLALQFAAKRTVGKILSRGDLHGEDANIYLRLPIDAGLALFEIGRIARFTNKSLLR